VWAQLVKFRVSQGNEEQLRHLDEQWVEEVGRRADSGWVRSLTLKNANDPQEWYELVFFESEEKARANERTPKHLAIVEQMQAASEAIDFVDLTPTNETSR
jgi:hypothetical protein